MRIALGADHAGSALKRTLIQRLEARGLLCDDFGTDSEMSVDYPDYARQVAQTVAGGGADRGILICGTGIGMAIAANKVPGVRAALVGDLESAKLCREHNDANVLALGARITAPDTAVAIADLFLATGYAGGRHQRRLDKIAALERLACARPTLEESQS
ncbi:MAG TPA: ribose 5-phosphate isomerase B [Vicinamibacterales bacterium]|jgi:ribose 5-phosphate isomerase B